ncbi:MAG: zf-HC2 domain-containing protein [Syntrophomonadaceae bacterium]|nr:zf-HC2 domain-containing protein [Syntrophomonadaceae bacterium]MDH7498713.1 zf-HC2 domain-containing protein [Syntrophomonadaceae bacterium]
MDCRRVDDLLFAFQDGDLPSPLRQSVEDHLAHCARCRASLALARAETDALRDTSGIPELSPHFSRAVRAAVQGGAVGSPGGQGWWWRLAAALRAHQRWRLAAGCAAAALLLFLALPGLTRQAPSTAPLLAPAAGGDTDLELRALPLTPSAEQDAAPAATERIRQSTRPQATAGPAPSPALNGQQAQPADRLRSPSATEGNGPVNPPLPAASAVPQPLAAEPAPTAAKSWAGTAVSPYVPRPGYLPEGYSLSRVESGVGGDVALTYERDGVVLTIRAYPRMDQADGNVEAAAGKGGAEGRQPEGTTVSWDVSHEGVRYRVEVCGTLPPEELARVAASCE